MAKPVVAEAARRRRRPTRSGTVLTEEIIVGTALRVLREHGSTGLTARRLGAALGADPSTLYRYFAGMDDLTRAIGDELMGRALEGWTATGDWRADLRALGRAIHASYLAHPQAAVLTASRVTGRPREIAVDETILGILRGAGLADAVAVGVYHAFIDQSLAFAALDAGSLALAEEARTGDEEMWRSTYARLPAESHPNIAATAELLARRMPHSAYPVALEMLLDHAAAQVARSGG
ncbi:MULTISPECIES: TetR/AcrR family transcriptional regulator [unclassified Streptomyces]|uniref:TetR/AcrR family transcriptional regulator n=1 Tax=unclassified Streptomyces TaxID=2593676 RepID=UPI001F03F8FA|nr:MULTISPECIES: TetR/AcrR family transcriptional regulator [unclassified Streptomyces]MCH0564164.1 TetR/AcrR family transcriptional regulator C-terminal domain-containing protein [Streptomyces sp. MUM 2J]MCH0568467.1 TetR/AcrR family transcriptional regulator C-terminal domain-containing protein [Streptomyces sp. MUM 136J]